MNSPSNPGDLAWSLAWDAAGKLIERATNIRLHNEIRLRMFAHRILAKSFLPATALVVASNGKTFEVVDDVPEHQPVYESWANEVVEFCRRGLFL